MRPTSKELSDLQEARIAQDLGGKVQPASGSRWGARRDVKNDAWLIEAKTTSQGYYRVITRDLAALQQQAYQQGRTPAYVVEFQELGSIAIVPRDILPDEPPVLIDAVDRKGWAFTYAEVAQIRIPFVLRLSCGVYCLMPYQQFLQVVEAHTP